MKLTDEHVKKIMSEHCIECNAQNMAYTMSIISACETALKYQGVTIIRDLKDADSFFKACLWARGTVEAKWIEDTCDKTNRMLEEVRDDR